MVTWVWLSCEAEAWGLTLGREGKAWESLVPRAMTLTHPSAWHFLSKTEGQIPSHRIPMGLFHTTRLNIFNQYLVSAKAE